MSGDEIRKKKRASPWIPARPLGKKSDPISLADVLVGAQDVFVRQSGLAMSQDEWRAIAGEKIASRTRMGRLRNGSLTIKVASSAWCQELSFLREDLIGRLQRAGHEVQKLRLVVDGTDDTLPAGESTRTGAFAKRRKAYVAGQSVAGEASKADTQSAQEEELPAELQARLAQVGDPNLRAVIAEAARRSLRRAKNQS
ncbi:MAG: DUF721 domain-containing protein [Polyangiaceae bacterium]|nr:DUF721 domain-containing protein [Polyangiaceae bacterium]